MLPSRNRRVDLEESAFGDPESLNLSQLRVILAVVRSGGITQAAETLGYLNASSVAYHIDRLERRLGVPLFKHRGRRLEPTELTLTICATADQVCSLVDNLRDNLDLFLKGESGRLRLGCSTLTLSLAKKLNEQLREQFSAIKAEIHQYWCSDEVRDAFAAAQIDVGLVCLGKGPAGDLPIIPCNERLMALVWKLHPLSNRRVIDLEELSGDTIIISDIGPDGDTLIEVLSQLGPVPIKTIARVATLSAAVERIQSGQGVGILPESTVNVNGLTALARPLSMRGEQLCRRVAIWASPESASHPAIKRVVNLARCETLREPQPYSTIRLGTQHSG